MQDGAMLLLYTGALIAGLITYFPISRWQKRLKQKEKIKITISKERIQGSIIPTNTGRSVDEVVQILLKANVSPEFCINVWERDESREA